MKITFELNPEQEEAMKALGGFSLRGGPAATPNEAAKAIFVGFIAEQTSRMISQRLMKDVVSLPDTKVATGDEAEVPALNRAARRRN